MRRDSSTIIGVVRSPKHEILSTSYEGDVDFADIIEKEVEVLGLLRNAGIPALMILSWGRRSLVSPISWMLCELIPHSPLEELTPSLQAELGDLTRRIHAIRPMVSTMPIPRSLGLRNAWAVGWAPQVGEALLRRLADDARA